MSESMYKVESIGEGLWRIDENGVCAYLIEGAELAVLIDSGFGTGDIRPVVERLTQKRVRLVNTHADRDHIGCNARFDDAWMHPAEYDRYHREAKDLVPLHPLWEGDEIDLGGRSLRVILIPGHTPGSIALLDARERILFSGDSIQSGLIFMFGPGRDLYAYIESMRKMLQFASQFDAIYPAHGAYPVSPSILHGLIEGATRVAAGDIDGYTPEHMNLPAKVYDAGVAKFLYA